MHSNGSSVGVAIGAIGVGIGVVGIVGVGICG